MHFDELTVSPSYAMQRQARHSYTMHLDESIITELTEKYDSTAGQSTESMFRLLDFQSLKDDWDKDGSVAPSNASISIALQLLSDLQEFRGLASVYPSMAGGVLIEWRRSDWAYSLQLLNDETVSFIGVNLSSDEEIDEITEVFDNYDKIKHLVFNHGVKLIGYRTYK